MPCCFMEIAILIYGLANLAKAVAAARVEARETEQVKARSQLKELQSMGIEVEEMKSDKIIKKDLAGDVDLVVKTNKGELIGLKRNPKGAYDIVGKWNYAGGNIVKSTEDTNQVPQQVKQKYACERVKEAISKRGYTISKQEVLEDNTIRLVVTRWR